MQREPGKGRGRREQNDSTGRWERHKLEVHRLLLFRHLQLGSSAVGPGCSVRSAGCRRGCSPVRVMTIFKNREEMWQDRRARAFDATALASGSSFFMSFPDPGIYRGERNRKRPWPMVYGHSEAAVTRVTLSSCALAIAVDTFSFLPTTSVQASSRPAAESCLSRAGTAPTGRTALFALSGCFPATLTVTFEHVLEGLLQPHLVLCPQA